MEKFHRAYKVRLYPNKKQEDIINKTLGCCRQVFNTYLGEKQDFYKNTILPVKDTATKEELNELYKTCKTTSVKELRKKFPYMKDVSSNALGSSARNADTALQNFFKSNTGKIKGEKRGFPKFKQHGGVDSYRDPARNMVRDNFSLTDGKMHLEKLGYTKFAIPNTIPSWITKDCVVKSVTVSKVPSGKYFASILYEFNKEYHEIVSHVGQESIGLDFKLENMYVDSNGKSGTDFGYVAQKQFHKYHLRKLQRQLDRKMFVKEHGEFKTRKVQKSAKNNEPDKIKKVNEKDKDPNKKVKKSGKYNVKIIKYVEKTYDNGKTVQVLSNRCLKAKKRLAKYEEHLANKRKDWESNEALRLTRNYKEVKIEDLNLKGQAQFMRNAKNYNDTAFYGFSQKLLDKGNINGCNVSKVDKWFASSQICHECGYKYDAKDYKGDKWNLGIRNWTCHNCGAVLDRDENAAKNIRDYTEKAK